MLEGFIPAFVLVALSEFGDRSQVSVILLGARYKAQHKKVFLGAMLAFALLFFVSVVFGSVLIAFLPAGQLKLISAVAFVIMGLYMLLKREKEKVTVKKNKEPFLASFSLIALSEIGDKTQVAVVVLAAGMRDAAGVFLGALLAEAVLTFIGVFAGREISKKVKMDAVKKVSGIAFILFGMAAFLEML